MAEETIALPSSRTEISGIRGWTLSRLLPEDWFVADPISRNIVFVGVDSIGTLFLQTGSKSFTSNSGDFLPAVEAGIEIEFTLGGNTYTFHGISESTEPTDEPYAWTPDNLSDSLAIRSYLAASPFGGTLVLRYAAPVRLDAELTATGYGSSRLTIAQPGAVRLVAELEATGFGLSGLVVTAPGDIRIAAELSAEGYGSSELAVAAPPVFADDTGDAISGTVGTAISGVTIPTATGNPNPAYFQVGASPAGITVTLPTLGNAGSITGTPTAVGSGTITIRAMNSHGNADWTVDYDFISTDPVEVVRATLTPDGDEANNLYSIFSGEDTGSFVGDMEVVTGFSIDRVFWTANANNDLRINRNPGGTTHGDNRDFNQYFGAGGPGENYSIFLLIGETQIEIPVSQRRNIGPHYLNLTPTAEQIAVLNSLSGGESVQFAIGRNIVLSPAAAPDVRIVAELTAQGYGASELLVAAPSNVRLSAELSATGYGSSRLTIAQPGATRLAAELTATGYGSSELTVTPAGPPPDIRLAAELTATGFGTSELDILGTGINPNTIGADGIDAAAVIIAGQGGDNAIWYSIFVQGGTPQDIGSYEGDLTVGPNDLDIDRVWFTTANELRLNRNPSGVSGPLGEDDISEYVAGSGSGKSVILLIGTTLIDLPLANNRSLGPHYLNMNQISADDIATMDGVQAGDRIGFVVADTGTGRDRREAVSQPPVRLAAELTAQGFGSSDLLVAAPSNVRLTAELSATGYGSSRLTIAQPGAVRLVAELEATGFATSRLAITEPASVRIAAELTAAGYGSSVLRIAVPGPVRIAAELNATGFGTSELAIAAPPPVRLSAELSSTGYGTSRLSVVEPGATRIAAELTATGFGTSELDILGTGINPNTIGADGIDAAAVIIAGQGGDNAIWYSIFVQGGTPQDIGSYEISIGSGSRPRTNWFATSRSGRTTWR